ncbi:hypothetical protein [Paraburkholderia sp. SIMBA_054]|uniref:hypothetical protein n=1 Tax=Paraburkholderia sp. SIMBA_054 TaxID=3085795 RepID=UPI00397DACDE
MAQHVEGKDFFLVRIRSGLYIVRNANQIDVGQVSGRKKNWVAARQDGSRISVGRTRESAAAAVLEEWNRLNPSH